MRQRLAKSVYWVGGKLSKIQTPRYTYKVVSFEPFITKKSETRTWMSCQTSMRLLKLSMRLAGVHWDHWALQYGEREETALCNRCGGRIPYQDLLISLGALKALAQGEPMDDVVMDYGVRQETVKSAASLLGWAVE